LRQVAEGRVGPVLVRIPAGECIEAGRSAGLCGSAGGHHRQMSGLMGPGVPMVVP
jgi:hypothetical protein